MQEERRQRKKSAWQEQTERFQAIDQLGLMEPEIKAPAEQGVSLLMQAAERAGRRGGDQPRAFNAYFNLRVPLIVAQTLTFKPGEKDPQ